MAKIPLFQQSKLASSRVGTPGVDQSGIALGTDIANAGKEAGNAIFSVAKLEFREQQREIRLRAAEQRALEKELKNAERDTTLARLDSDYSVQLNEVDNALREEHNFNTEGSSEKLKEASINLKDKMQEGIQDPILRQKVEKTLINREKEFLKQHSDWQKSRVPAIMKSNVEAMAGNLIREMKDGGKSETDIQNLIGQYHGNNIVHYNRLYGAQGEEKLRQDVEGGVKEYLADTSLRYASEEGHPTLNQRINMFDQFMDPSAKKKFYSQLKQDAANEARALEKQEQYNVSVRGYEIVNETKGLAATGGLTQVELDNKTQELLEIGAPASMVGAMGSIGVQAKKIKIKEETKQQKAERKQKAIDDRNETRRNLSEKMSTFIGKKSVKGQGKVDTPIAGTTPKDLGQLLGEVEQAELKGHITTTKANAARIHINTAMKTFDRTDPKGAEDARQLGQIYNNIMKIARKEIPTNRKAANDYAAAVMEDFHTDYDRLTKIQGHTPTDAQMKRLLRNTGNRQMVKIRQQYGL